MKLTKSKLKQIIKEELTKIVREEGWKETSRGRWEKGDRSTRAYIETDDGKTFKWGIEEASPEPEGSGFDLISDGAGVANSKEAAMLAIDKKLNPYAHDE